MSRLADAFWPDVERGPRRVLVVPVGSLEQHGPHLPLDTDAFLATTVATHLQVLRPEAGLAPTVPFGASGEHAAFPGTVSIGSAALQLLMIELVRHASLTWGAVLVVNGHGGNLTALREARQTCVYEQRRLEVVHLSTPGGDAHAGRTETSLMLHLAPERVRLDALEAGDVTPVRQLMPRLAEAGVRAVSPNGVLGDPTGASPEEGERLMNALVAHAVAAYDAC